MVCPRWAAAAFGGKLALAVVRFRFKEIVLMIQLKRCGIAFAAVAVIATTSAGGAIGADKKAKASSNCVIKAAEGTGTDTESAKFQVDEALLQAVDWGAWAAWMASKTTPGYDYGKRTYKCKPGGLGVTCVGQAKICKL